MHFTTNLCVLERVCLRVRVLCVGVRVLHVYVRVCVACVYVCVLHVCATCVCVYVLRAYVLYVVLTRSVCLFMPALNYCHPHPLKCA